METVKAARAPISKTLRFSVFKRDGFQCAYCGATPPRVMLEVDHINPVANGGENEMDNLITACFPCNRGKGKRLLTDVPQSLSDRAAEALEREDQIAGYEQIMRTKRLRLEADADAISELFSDHYRQGLTHSEYASLKRFVERLGFHECVDSFEIAVAKNVYSKFQAWKYFCGVCWGKIRDRGQP